MYISDPSFWQQQVTNANNKNLDLSYSLYEAEQLLLKVVEQKEIDNDFDELYWKIKSFLKEE